MLLLQHPTNILSDQLLEWYLTNFNITKFCVGNIEQAKQLKNYNPNFEIIGSITMKIDKQKLLSNEDYFKYFNGFVLWFPFNRDLDAIAELPKDFKYVLLANGGCHIYCTGTQHWYAKSFEEDQACFKKCNLSQLRKNPVTSMTVRPMDLQFFDPFITYYKIQGREWTTQRLIKHIVIYDVNTESIYPCVNYYPELYHQRLEYKTDVE